MVSTPRPRQGPQENPRQVDAQATAIIQSLQVLKLKPIRLYKFAEIAVYEAFVTPEGTMEWKPIHEKAYDRDVLGRSQTLRVLPAPLLPAPLLPAPLLPAPLLPAPLLPAPLLPAPLLPAPLLPAPLLPAPLLPAPLLPAPLLPAPLLPAPLLPAPLLPAPLLLSGVKPGGAAGGAKPGSGAASGRVKPDGARAVREARQRAAGNPGGSPVGNSTLRDAWQ